MENNRNPIISGQRRQDQPVWAGQEAYDALIGTFMVMMLMLPILTLFFGALMRMFIGQSKLVTYCIYGAYIVYVYSQYNRIETNYYKYDSLVFSISIPLIVLGLSYMLFPENRNCFSPNFVSLFCEVVLYIPIGVMSTYMRDWRKFLDKLGVCSVLTAVMGFVGINSLQMTRSFTYMNISNALLPGFLAAWYLAYCKRKYGHFICAGLILYLQVTYGGRMSLFSCLIYMILTSVNLIRRMRRRDEPIPTVILFSIIVLPVLACIAGLMSDAFIDLLASIGGRSVRLLLQGRMTAASGRDELYIFVKDIILHMKPFQMYGLFGDRMQLQKYMSYNDAVSGYAHNLIYELIIEFGWILAIALLLIVGIRLIRRYIRSQSDDYLDALVLFVCLILIRLMVSGSWLVEGQFFLLLLIIYNRNDFERWDWRVDEREGPHTKL